MTELISVIVPIYNVEKYLRTCLNSLLEQTYENFEVLMINNGSTDSSATICQEYAERDSRFVYFEKENGGLASARNFGIDHSKGMYISFIDSDDWVVETYLLDLYNAIVKSKSDISISHHIGYKDDTATYFIYVYEYFEKEYYSSQFISELPTLELQNIVYHTSWGKLFRKNLFDNIRFTSGKLIEDTRIGIKLFLEASKIIYINKGLYIYREREGSIIKTVSEKLLEDTLDALVERICIVTMRGLYSDSFKKNLLWYLKNKKMQALESGLQNSEIYRRYQEMIYLIESEA